MEPVHRRLEPHSQPGRLGDHAPRRNHELVDERRQRMTERCRLAHGGLPYSALAASHCSNVGPAAYASACSGIA
jgi:hypothetical protein